MKEYKVKNPFSFSLLVGHSGYKALPHSLHSVQTRRDKRSGAVSLCEHTEPVV